MKDGSANAFLQPSLQTMLQKHQSTLVLFHHLLTWGGVGKKEMD